MTQIPDGRYLKLRGSPYQVGYQLGLHIGSKLEANIDNYIQDGPIRFGEVSKEWIKSQAIGWFESLPMRFRKEIEGMAKGSGVALSKIAEWGFADSGRKQGCSSFMIRKDQDLWIGRNNDLWVPDLCGYAIQRHVEDRIGTLIFGMQGELFAATGLNQAGLWLHYNWLPAGEESAQGAQTPYVLLTEILETCTTIDEAEAILLRSERTGGMLVFAAESRSDSCAVIECSCKQAKKQNLTKGYLSGTNHFLSLARLVPDIQDSSKSIARKNAIDQKLSVLPETFTANDLIAVLADPLVEQYDGGYGTVYANLYSPTRNELWFTFGGFPAASHGNWQRLPVRF